MDKESEEVLDALVCSCGALSVRPRPPERRRQDPPEWWSDGTDANGGLPHANLLGRCMRCGTVHWVPDMETLAVPAWCRGEEPLPWEAFSDAGDPAAAPQLRRALRPIVPAVPAAEVRFLGLPSPRELLQWCLVTDPEPSRRCVARMLAWRQWNQVRRVQPPVEMTTGERENLAALVELHRPGGPVEVLLHAEMLRQLGRFRAAADHLDKCMHEGGHDWIETRPQWSGDWLHPQSEPWCQELWHLVRTRDVHLRRIPSAAECGQWIRLFKEERLKAPLG